MTTAKSSLDVSALDLPTDYPRLAQTGYSPTTRIHPLPESLGLKALRFSQEMGVAPFVTFFAVFQTILSRYSGQEAFRIGCLRDSCGDTGGTEGEETWSDRPILVVADCSGSPNLRELLTRVQESLNEPEIIRIAGPFNDQAERDTNACFTLLEPSDPIKERGTIIAAMDSLGDLFRSDLRLAVSIAKSGLELHLTGNGELYEMRTLDRFFGHFETLLAAGLANPEENVFLLPFLTEAELRQLVVDWNSEELPPAIEECLHETFEAQVERSPDAVAIIRRGTEVTYAELNARANRLANYLKELGVGPEVLVGLCLDRSVDLVVGVLAILKAGGAYVPLDPTYPPDRIAFMLRDAKAAVLLTESPFVKSLPASDAEVVLMDRDREKWAGLSSVNPRRTTTKNNLAYVLYTSGSTGQPKGVALEHKNAVALVVWGKTVYDEEEYSGVLFATSICFDLSVFEIFCPLSAGGRIILAKNALELAELPEANLVTLINTVPSVMAEIVRMKALPNSVKTINLAGEYSSVELVRDTYASASVERIYDLYGATEDTTHSTLYLRTPNGPASVGRPFPSTQIYLLDRHGQPVPVGIPGEIYLGGIGLARGYLNRPELTAERFLKNPFREDPTARIYKTGDSGRYRPDGNLEYLGRLDHQVKIRGYRVELGEIETLLNTHPGVAKAVVIAREDKPGDKKLVAYFVPGSHSVPKPEEFQTFLRKDLPEYMVPTAFVELPEFPRTPSGKISRKTLPAPENRRPELEEAFVAPRNQLESHLADRWREILELDQIGIHDRFFQLGGNSLLAARFINELQRELGETIYVVTIFESPTIAEYASLLQKDYAQSVIRLFPEMEGLRKGVGKKGARITVRDLDAMRKCIPSLSPTRSSIDDQEPKNRPALFILAPPRSGTTLLRIMLAGHLGLFCPAELQLLGFNTLEERRRAFADKYSLWLEGTLRAIMELKDCGADRAKSIMEEYENKGYTTKRFYRVLQEWIGDRTLVDKSPSYATDLDTLRKAERDFEGALYVHLIRHPHAMAKSFEGYHMDQVLYLYDHPFTPLRLGEMIWSISHQNTLEFLKEVPQERQFRMRFEDLVTEPERVMREMCARLGFEFQPDLLTPYKDADKKMTDGIYAESMPMGDLHFHRHQRINPEMAEIARKVATDDFLGEPTWEIAEQLGYPRPTFTAAPRSAAWNSTEGESRAERKRGRQDRRERRLAHRESHERDNA